MNEFLVFINWAHRMYDDNCAERWENGDKPYASFQIYYDKHYEWLRRKFEEQRVLQ